MEEIPTLKAIINAVKGLGQRKRGKRDRKAVYSDELIIALASYQKLASFNYAQQMLQVLTSFNLDVPSPARFSERKAMPLKKIILAISYVSYKKLLENIVDSKKLRLLISPGLIGVLYFMFTLLFLLINSRGYSYSLFPNWGGVYFDYENDLSGEFSVLAD